MNAPKQNRCGIAGFRAWAIGFAILTIPALATAQGPSREEKQGMHTTSRVEQSPRPLFELPKNIPAPPNQLTCHADFTGATNGRITIHVINRSNEPATMAVHSRGVSFKAHRELPDGRWERLQPANSWAHCGFDISKLEIHPGMFAVVSADYIPPGDKTANIRYQIPGNPQFTTSTGPGSWDEAERDIAQLDGASWIELPQWIDTRVIYSRDDQNIRRRPRARIELETAYLDLLLHYREYRAPRLWLDQLVAECNHHPAGWREVARRRQTLLRDHPPLAAQNPAEFIKHCLNLLKKETPNPGSTHGDPSRFGQPVHYPGMLWSAIGDIPLREPDATDLPWQRIISTLNERLPYAKTEELDGMAKVMALERQIHEHFPTEFLLLDMANPHRGFRAHCVRLLLQRNLSKELTGAAEELDQAGRFAVMELICAPPALSSRSGPIHDYLLARSKEDPSLALQAIRRGTRRYAGVNLSPGIWIQLRPHLDEIVMIGLDGPIEISCREARETILFALGTGYRRHFATLKKLTESQAYYYASEMKTDRNFFLANAARRLIAQDGGIP